MLYAIAELKLLARAIFFKMFSHFDFQAAAVLREILAISGGANDPHVLCGSFNLREDSIVSKLLSDGHLTSDILNELKAKTNVPVPDKEVMFSVCYCYS